MTVKRRKRKNNNLKIWIITTVSILVCIGAAIAVGCFLGMEKDEYDPYAPSPGQVQATTAEDTTEEITENTTEDTVALTADTAETDTVETAEEPDEEQDWNLLLVNPWNSIPEDFEAEFVDLADGHKVDSRAYPDLQAMMDDCRAQGLSPYICSSYRTYDYQKGLHDKQVNKYLSYGYSEEEAYAEASKWVAVPGTSEHHTGLALDIVASYYIVLDDSQEEMPEQQWLMENSYKYGWILRYPNDKTDVTGIYYEPWHYRYVGKEAAKEIHDRGITLEEYLSAGHE